ncbi:MAG: type II toxin-antitoxin system VapC family toxin [bacterium]|nr:type II toxin-antitoxin system VapC family toxin [bacterium]
MNIYYLDSSAVVKRYVEEIGSKWVKLIADPSKENLINIAQIGMVEVAAAFSRKNREGMISEFERDEVLGIFFKDCEDQYQIIEIDDRIIKSAIDLTCTRPLRGYDAIQLATASVINEAMIKKNLSPLIFLSADDNLIEAAKEEGLLTDNPNLHS